MGCRKIDDPQRGTTPYYFVQEQQEIPRMSKGNV